MPRRATSTSFGGKSGNARGRGPAKGAPNAGAPPKSLVIKLSELRQSAKAQQALEDAACDPDSRGFATAWKTLSLYDKDRPAEKREHSGKIEVAVVMKREGARRTAG